MGSAQNNTIEYMHCSQTIRRENVGAIVVCEPRMPIGSTFCKPDMVVFDRGKYHAFVLDAQVTGTRVLMSGTVTFCLVLFAYIHFAYITV